MILRDFNPTLVQLELSGTSWKEITETAFQSHIGAIRTMAGGLTAQWLTDFNPTLVQLELKILLFSTLSKPVFQSHIGAIRTRG